MQAYLKGTWTDCNQVQSETGVLEPGDLVPGYPVSYDQKSNWIILPESGFLPETKPEHVLAVLRSWGFKVNVE